MTYEEFAAETKRLLGEIDADPHSAVAFELMLLNDAYPEFEERFIMDQQEWR